MQAPHSPAAHWRTYTDGDANAETVFVQAPHSPASTIDGRENVAIMHADAENVKQCRLRGNPTSSALPPITN